MIRTLLAGLLAVAFLFPAASAWAQNFRMETDVFVGKQKDPICQTLTLFTDGLVYDFLVNGDANEATVYDMSSSRVLLLDTKRCVKTVLSHEQLLQMTASIKANAPPENALFHFAAHPQFETRADDLTNELAFASEPLTYRVKGVRPQAAEAAASYQQFADFSARLNACRPGNLPPFARLEVNRELAGRGLIPEEITLVTVAPGRLGSRKLELRSRHLVNWVLSTKDRKRIETVGQQIATFEAVSFQQFVEPAKVARK